MNEPKRLSMIWVLLAALVAVIIVFDIAYAGDPCQGGHNCNDGGSVVASGEGMATSEAIISGSRSYGFGGADVDINDYYRSYSYLFGLIQETKSNPLAVARDLMVEGNYEGAAFLRCQPWGVYKAFGGKEECIKALSKPPIEPTKVINQPVDNDDEDNERLEPIYARLMDLEAQRQSDADNARKATIRANTAAREAEQVEADRKEYAQQMYEELKEWN